MFVNKAPNNKQSKNRAVANERTIFTIFASKY